MNRAQRGIIRGVLWLLAAMLIGVGAVLANSTAEAQDSLGWDRDWAEVVLQALPFVIGAVILAGIAEIVSASGKTGPVRTTHGPMSPMAYL